MWDFFFFFGLLGFLYFSKKMLNLIYTLNEEEKNRGLSQRKDVRFEEKKDEPASISIDRSAKVGEKVKELNARLKPSAILFTHKVYHKHFYN